MGDDQANSQDSGLPTSDSRYDGFVRELEQRLYDGCSVTFTVPHYVGTTLACDVLKRLEARGCYAAEIDLSNTSTIEELTLRLLQGVLQLRIGIKPLSDCSLNDFWEYLSQPEIRTKIEDILDVSCLLKLTEIPLALLDEAVNLLQRTPEQSGTRLVVWFHEFQVIEKIDDLLLERLRAIFQHQTHVSFSFTGSERELMTMLFADHHQAFYRFAVLMSFAGA
ncbi:hypothetical protein [Alicyclobacillus ferrooxydans]|uniref:Uncharacterized protein n=1 Tax=Alicyclobacillus ferrooxydans TaxID=471514 RepID=A0A0P9CE48_9BACL|nr:hypothetical protein [Alicyclobacillus ferrooxydans]KPV44088.1 hypothetical protein AN477_08395 [Alicyclobacillus ferrooxydans]